MGSCGENEEEGAIQVYLSLIREIKIKPNKSNNKILLSVENSQVAGLATDMVLILNHFK